MNTFRKILPALLLLAAIVPSNAATSPLVILLGDSIRMNYRDAVKKRLQGKAVVWSPKDNCRHTAYTLEHLEEWLSGRKPRVVHINVGLHDMFLSAKTGRTRNSLATYEKNLRAIFAKLRQLTDAQIIFALTTAVIEGRQAASKTYGRVVRRNEDVDRFNAKARAIAKELGITINDLNAFMKRSDPASLLRDDGIHLSPAGCLAVGNEVARMINTELHAK